MHLSQFRRIIGSLIVLAALSGCSTKSVYEACTSLNPSSPNARADASKTTYNSCMAERGHRVSQFLLGTQYELGEGVSQDFAEAVHWYKQSARDELGRSYFSMTRPGESVSLLQFRSETENPRPGLPEAKFAVGRMYYLGRGVEKNDGKARKWFRRAAVVGNQNAEEWLKLVEADSGE